LVESQIERRGIQMMNSKNSKRAKAKPQRGGGGSYDVRLPPALMAQIERWALQNGNLSRRSAIARLVAQGLSVGQPARPYRKKSTTKASSMAAREIDRRGDPLATATERARRKRRLLKGPVEFRTIRKRQPKR
jgi:hypothetical protein